MKIKSKISKVSTQSLGTLGIRVIDTVNNSGIEEAVNSKQFQRLVEVNDEYQQAINPINLKVMSSQIKTAFNKRNRLFSEFITYVKGLTVSDDEAVKAAALKIYEEITKFGTGFSSLKITEKTLRFIRIIESLKQADYAEAIQKTKLSNKLNAFDIAQHTYENLYMERGNQVSSKIAASNVRKNMEVAMKKHLDETAYLNEKNETDDWNTLYVNLKKRYAEVNASFRAKQSQTDNNETNATVTSAS